MRYPTRAKIYATGLLLTLLAASVIIPPPLSRAGKAQTAKHESPKGESAPAAPAAQQSEQPIEALLAAPYWSTADGFVSTIEMKNYHVSAPLTVTPVLYPEHGREIALDPITLKPSETRLLNINRTYAVETRLY